MPFLQIKNFFFLPYLENKVFNVLGAVNSSESNLRGGKEIGKVCS